MDAQMEAMLKAMGQKTPERQKILELNPSHELVVALNAEFDKNAESQTVADIGELLFNQALILEGNMPTDPNRFTELLTKVMVQVAK
jgi:molecular chaperone HtpG